MKSLLQITLIPICILCSLISCIVPESTHVKPQFHLLSKSVFDQNQTASLSSQNKETNNRLIGHPFYLRQIELPYYLQENRIVKRPKQGEIEFRENDRWGEPLTEGIGRVVGLNLSQILKSPYYSVYPHRKKIGANWEIGITIIRFENVSNNQALLEASWEIFNANFKNGTYPFRSGKVDHLEAIQPARGKKSLIKDEVVALSDLLGVLSESVCRSIVSSNL
ncbi:MAG: PqiC family protein [Opitutales bacterium]|nr:PqiC family protein [Opitutales bacterium]MDG1324489.1 PqiC family protein [Opitutales bacterium]